MKTSQFILYSACLALNGLLLHLFCPSIDPVSYTHGALFVLGWIYVKPRFGKIFVSK